MYILKRKGNVEKLKRTMNPAKSEIRYSTVSLEEGDVLFVHTDGIKDRFILLENSQTGEYNEKKLGTKRLLQILRNVNMKRLSSSSADYSSLFLNELSMYETLETVDDETAIFVPV